MINQNQVLANFHFLKIKNLCHI